MENNNKNSLGYKVGQALAFVIGLCIAAILIALTVMKNLVIFSVEELYDLIHDKPVTDEKSGIIYMSIDCYEKEVDKNE